MAIHIPHDLVCPFGISGQFGERCVQIIQGNPLSGWHKAVEKPGNAVTQPKRYGRRHGMDEADQEPDREIDSKIKFFRSLSCHVASQSDSLAEISERGCYTKGSTDVTIN